MPLIASAEVLASTIGSANAVNESTVKTNASTEITAKKNGSRATAPVIQKKDPDAVQTLNTIKTVSLRKRAIEKTVETTQKQEEVFAVNQPFTGEVLELAWRQFIETIPDDPHLVNAMRSFPPALLEDYQIEVAFQNQALEAKLLQLKPEIERFLHHRLQNNRIRMRLRMAESHENTRPFTSREKLDFMVQKNPNLELLFRSFGLEI